MAGVNVIVGVVRVNVAVPTLPTASVMVNVFVASDVTGIVNVVAGWSAPAAVVVVVLKVTAWPLTFAVIALVAAKPVPVTVTTVPLLPTVGVKVSDGVTVIAVWTVRPVFVSCNVSRYVPENRPVGTTNHVSFVYASAPAFGIVRLPNWFAVPITTTAPATTRLVALNDASVIAVKPVTVMSIFAPDAAVNGALIVGAPSTVMVVDAVSTGVLTPAVPMVNCSV